LPFLALTLEEGGDMRGRTHAQALSDPFQRQGRLWPQARRDAILPRIALAAALQAADFACGRKPFC
jgi:hypothetical protein